MKIIAKNKGFTLVELLVTMLVFIVVIVITADAFNTILVQSVKLVRSEESNIEGIIGLEMLRHDLQQTGYGLFTEPMTSGYTGEAAGAPAMSYNESALTSPPRAVVFGNNLGVVADNSSESGNTYNLLAGTDYLAVKATSVGRTDASHRWSYLTKDAGGAVVPYRWASSDENFASSEKVMMLRRRITPSSTTLAVEPSSSGFYYQVTSGAFANYSTNYNQYVLYGLDKASGTAPRMPFNRTDYFVARPTAAGRVPNVCAPNTGILYKTVVNQSDGKLTYHPVLDCVADMQMVLMWDLMNGPNAGQDGTVDTYSNADGTAKSGPATLAQITAALADPAELRSSLKGIKVYVLAQNGRMDSKYISPSPLNIGPTTETALTRPGGFNIAAAGWSNYRWKVYQIIVRPKNLLANQ